MSIDVTALYTDLHANPELSFEETRTAGIAAENLERLGYTVTTGLGGTGVVGLLENGEGPTVLLRADMDALPVEEQTGLAYASTAPGVMHACGHDVHVACLIGAAEKLVETRSDWSGTLVLVFQPAEELGRGATAMIKDGLYDIVPKPDIVLGQHVGPLPAGFIGLRSGPAMAASDSVNLRLFGEGGHGSRPESTVDPVVLAAATVMRLQTIVSRELAGGDTAVVTIGQIHAGTKNNIIPAEATLGFSIRTFDTTVRTKILEAIERIARAESEASGSPREPEITYDESLPATFNDGDAVERTTGALRTVVGDMGVFDPGILTGSEDVSNLSTAGESPLVFWILGGADPSVAEQLFASGRLPDDLPSNHSPFYAPVIEPTLQIGVNALVAAAREWLD